MITFNDAATERLGTLLRAAPPGTVGLRIEAKKRDGGLDYGMAFEREIGPGDMVCRIGDGKVIIAPRSQFLLIGVEVGFVDSDQGGGFVFAKKAGGGCSGCPSDGKC